MAEKPVIEYKEREHMHAIEQKEVILENIQSLIDQWEKLTGTELATADLPAFLTGEQDQLKELAFNKLSTSKDATLFGINIRKSKAVELLDLPDLTELSTQIKSHATALGSSFNTLSMEAGDLEIKNKQVKNTTSFDAELQATYTTTADTPGEVARLEAFADIVDTLTELHQNKLIDLRTSEIFEKMFHWNMSAGVLSFDTNFVKNGRA